MEFSICVDGHDGSQNLAVRGHLGARRQAKPASGHRGDFARGRLPIVSIKSFAFSSSPGRYLLPHRRYSHRGLRLGSARPPGAVSYLRWRNV